MRSPDRTVVAGARAVPAGPVVPRQGPNGMSPAARQLARDAVRSSLPFTTFSTFGDFYAAQVTP